MEQPPQPDKPSAASAELDARDVAIGRRLRVARDAKGLTQKQLSVRTKFADPEEKGISRTAIVGYEAGTSRPGTRELRILCESLHISPNHLIYGSDEPFQTAHAALEGLRTHSRPIAKALQVALLVTALQDHEREALMSLILSLAGRELGDERMAGIRMCAMFWVEDFEAKTREMLGGMPVEEFNRMPLREIAGMLSRQYGSTYGTKLRFSDDGEVISGEQLYPDPDH